MDGASYLQASIVSGLWWNLNFQAEVISPSEELKNSEVVNDFDIEEEEIQIENRYMDS